MDRQVVEQQPVRIRLIGWRGGVRERRAEVAEPRRGDDAKPRPGELRPPAVEGLDVASEDPVRHEERSAFALIRVFDGAESCLESLRRD